MKFGLIGDPIATSLSPALFTAAYGGRLTYDLIEGQSFPDSWKRFLADYDAINVTAPFKELAYNEVLTLARKGNASVSGPCFKTGAANLIVKTPEGLQAHNSDFTGIILSVAEQCFPGLTGQCYRQFGPGAYVKVHQFMRQNIEEYYGTKPQALIVGTGGAGKAAAVAAAEMGYATVLMNRTLSKAQSLVTALPEYGFLADPITDFAAALRECDLVIYTLPVSLDGLEKLSVEDFKGEIGSRPKTILEANYKNPSFSSDTLSRLEEAGALYVSGRTWLLYQALTGYGIMTGEAPAFGPMSEVML